MSRTIQVGLEEAKEVFYLLEEMNAFLHQPTRYDDSPQVTEFVVRVYPDLHRVFYDVVWNWLPPDVQQEIENRPSPFE